jgi:uncharacterized protein (TIGR03437 family)
VGARCAVRKPPPGGRFGYTSILGVYARVDLEDVTGPIIAPNMFVEVKGLRLAKVGDSRQWQASDFVNNQMPTKLDGVSVTVNGKSAWVCYISPTQVNIVTPPDAMQGTVMVQVTNQRGS